MSRISQKEYVFDDFILQPSERRLLRLGAPVSLEAKAFDLLVMLVERSGTLIKKEEILDAVWADEFVEESNIPVKVGEIRKALGDKKNGSWKFIETVSKHGYRFCHSIEPLFVHETDHAPEEAAQIDRREDLANATRAGNRSKSEAHKKAIEAQKLLIDGKHSDGVKEMIRALEMAQADEDEEEEVEILSSLALVSGGRHGEKGDRQHYLALAEKKLSGMSIATRLIFLRSKAAALQEAGDLNQAEETYRTALNLCNTEPEDEKGNLAIQACVIRSSLVHLLCNRKRTEEARGILAECEEFASQNRAVEDGALFLAAMEAGIHLAQETGNEDDAILRINQLEKLALSSRLAEKIGGDLINVANHLSQGKAHRAALAASESALRLNDRISSDLRESFLSGVLYTLAMVHFHAGRLDEALERANSLVNMPVTPKIAPIRFAAAQLISVISRQIGDLATAVDKGELALELAQELDSSFMAKMNLAEALADKGETERALKLAQEAYRLVEGRPSLPTRVSVDILSHISNYASQLGDDATLKKSMTRLAELSLSDNELNEIIDRNTKLVEANSEIRKRIIDISLIGKSPKVVKKALNRTRDFSQFLGDSTQEVAKSTEAILTLHRANALTIAPLIKWWEDTADDPNAAALDYDYWGRGCFAQILQNLRSFPHSLNVTVEVRSLDDIKQVLRFWALYADFILVLWKGPTESGRFLHMIDGEWFGPWGAGYMLALGTQLKSKKGRMRFPAMGYGSWLPEDVTKFLVKEARQFLSSGRLLVVPASGVGCVSPGHGVMEQLLTEAANCLPAIHLKQRSDLEIGSLPYALDIPVKALFDFVEETQDELINMRNLLLSKTAHVRMQGLQPSPKVLELEIADALKHLRDQTKRFAKKQDLSLSEQGARMGISPFHLDGNSLVAGNDSMYSPLLTLESMGYGWKIGASSQSTRTYRYEPAEGEAIGAWLAPPKSGVNFLVAKAVDSPDVSP